MLDLKLTWAMAPDEMEPCPCGICGVEFSPRAVLCNFVTAYELMPICEACLSHLAERAEREEIPADWGELRRFYRLALDAYPAPAFPSMEALLEYESTDPYWTGMSTDIDTEALAPKAAR